MKTGESKSFFLIVDVQPAITFHWGKLAPEMHMQTKKMNDAEFAF